MTNTNEHVSVFYQQVIEWLVPHDGGGYVDATLGAGGHAAGVLEASAPKGRLLGFDADPAALKIAAQNLARFGDRVVLVHSNFENLNATANTYGFSPVDGIVLDLGLSSMQLSDAERGFSFLSNGMLDMRFNPDDPMTAADLVNLLDEKELL
jgi:16S rRNA (cytosine1402-N4)-methyltransferase